MMNVLPVLAVVILGAVNFVDAATLSNSLCSDSSSGTAVLAFNATNCQNIAPTATCTAVFTGTAAGTPSRLPTCLTYDSSVVLQCANTCGFCCATPQQSCGDSPQSPIPCSTNANLCTSSQWSSIMTTYCQGTCGLCLANTTCMDVNTNCAQMLPLCQNVNFYAYMTQKCAKSCNLCSTASTTASTSTCSDVATNCAATASLCNNSVYYALMTQKCPATCGRCSSSSSVVSSTTCTNANSNCANYVANGFCSSTFYTTAQKQQYCASSCGLCSTGK